MTTLLRIDASLRMVDSNSRQLGDDYQRRWLEAYPNGNTCRRDLAVEPIPHLSQKEFESFHTRGSNASIKTTLSDELIQELLEIDHLLICTPLYNLTLPSTLKAYFDHVVRQGFTFDVLHNELVGLLTHKKATIITARGGISTPDVTDDFQTPYLIEILRFMGITDIASVTLEGTSLTDPEKAQYLSAAKQQLNRLFEPSKNMVWNGPFSDEDRRHISQLRNNQAKVIIDGDAKAYTALCAKDIQLLIPGHDTVSGHQQFLQAEQALFTDNVFTLFNKYPDKIERSGDLAVETGLQEVALQNRSDGTGVFAARQKYMHVYRLTPVGWRYSALMSNPCG